MDKPNSECKEQHWPRKLGMANIILCMLKILCIFISMFNNKYCYHWYDIVIIELLILEIISAWESVDIYMPVSVLSVLSRMAANVHQNLTKGGSKYLLYDIDRLLLINSTSLFLISTITKILFCSLTLFTPLLKQQHHYQFTSSNAPMLSVP